LYDIVVVGAESADGAEEDEKEAYDHPCNHAKMLRISNGDVCD